MPIFNNHNDAKRDERILEIRVIIEGMVSRSRRTNKRHYTTDVECVTDQQRRMQNLTHKINLIAQTWILQD